MNRENARDSARGRRTLGLGYHRISFCRLQARSAKQPMSIVRRNAGSVNGPQNVMVSIQPAPACVRVARASRPRVPAPVTTPPNPTAPQRSSHHQKPIANCVRPPRNSYARHPRRPGPLPHRPPRPNRRPLTTDQDQDSQILGILGMATLVAVLNMLT